MSDPRDRREGLAPSAEHWAGGLVEGSKKYMKDAGKMMLREGPKGVRIIARRIPGLPGLVYDAATIAKADDRWRAGTAVVGGALGGTIGAVGGPVGAMVGSAAGEKAGEFLYDHKDDIKAWMDDRWAHLTAPARQDVRRYAPLHRLPGNPYGL